MLITLAGIGIVIFVLVLDTLWESEPPAFARTETSEYFEVRYEWTFDQRRWEYEARIPITAYQYFRDRSRQQPYSEFVLNPDDDEWLNRLAGRFSQIADDHNWGEWQTIGFVLSFVQSMPYTSDKVTTGYDNYPRYPVETIVDGGGDCEDTSILFASIVRGMGYGVVLLHLTQDAHMAAGVAISQAIVDGWNLHYPLTYYRDGDRLYAFCETTGTGWKLGQKPPDLGGAVAILKLH
ncbi:MAG: hypothetical protein IBX68_05275 [Dehalococcoidia bacterium]|nr:hypothetical protein [Dehalococcoidia bacterium]